MTTSEPFQLISIDSKEGRIGRFGWSNQKAWGGRGRAWWVPDWLWADVVPTTPLPAPQAGEGEA